MDYNGSTKENCRPTSGQMWDNSHLGVNNDRSIFQRMSSSLHVTPFHPLILDRPTLWLDCVKRKHARPPSRTVLDAIIHHSICACIFYFSTFSSLVQFCRWSNKTETKRNRTPTELAFQIYMICFIKCERFSRYCRIEYIKYRFF